MDPSITRDRRKASELAKSLATVAKSIFDRHRKKDKVFQIILMTLTAISSCSLWVLIKKDEPIIAAYAGAIVTTIITFLNVYQKTSFSPDKEYRLADKLHSSVNDSLFELLRDEQFKKAKFISTVSESIKSFEKYFGLSNEENIKLAEIKDDIWSFATGLTEEEMYQIFDKIK